MYSELEHSIWSTLYNRVLQYLGDIADESIMVGLRKLNLPSDHAPQLNEINEKLKPLTDWQLVPMDDMVDDTKFIGMLADKLYPCRVWLRTQEKVDSLVDDYDMFHDVLGHSSLLYLNNYSNYLEQLGELALKYIDNHDAILYLKRVYWHTIQYGLIESDKSLKIYGAHMLSSRNEASFSMSAGVPKYDHNVSIIMDTPYIKNRFQEKYFVIKSYDQLLQSIPEIEKELLVRLKK
jgi:phenylalanine-4-hydroxylase